MANAAASSSTPTANQGDAVVDLEKHSYSIWALPPADVSRKIKKVMEGLRAEFDGPEIEPHIAVVGSIRMTRERVVNKFRSGLCQHRHLHAFVAKVEEVGTRCSYYQCVFLGMHPSEELISLVGSCNADFNFHSYRRPVYLSLLYGNLTEEERKKAQEMVNHVDESIGSLSFPVTRLALYQTDYKDKTLKSWEKIAECPLQFN